MDKAKSFPLNGVPKGLKYRSISNQSIADDCSSAREPLLKGKNQYA
jgi:hypothetical protein